MFSASVGLASYQGLKQLSWCAIAMLSTCSSSPGLHMNVQKVYLLQQSQILGNLTQCLLRHYQAYKKCKRQSH